ncbi:hypothetical protein FSARC_5100 [Fusarium sarcochroum]|uniref:Uncharacterized protein n=1 Tax=Fusarium sarcochroum TaxID=1208366 RepID=A0A8H4U099_9HYPO|nr:hypothetical protein FSARC_5100 [Fusarium sarcochroum]
MCWPNCFKSRNKSYYTPEKKRKKQRPKEEAQVNSYVSRGIEKWDGKHPYHNFRSDHKWDGPKDPRYLAWANKRSTHIDKLERKVRSRQQLARCQKECPGRDSKGRRSTMNSRGTRD